MYQKMVDISFNIIMYMSHDIFFLSGVDTGKVVIWNTAPVRNEVDETDKNVPRIICQMDNHIGNTLSNYSNRIGGVMVSAPVG